ncbi:histidinol phosphate aminotransferase [Aliisedimentitalea scapharcae]|uniref:Histidinol phosphate aminotransferase n=1 Tax=Aliisedimentitalea scapharcae TaxID=1524259 RepID=A0ABZ2XQH2_9RHOB|nr:histidinol phosphate aminotransferase [Rhodobacteraceae bacterium M382]
MSDSHERPRAPDYTNAAITMLGVNLMWIFFVIWVLFGVVPVLLLALLINHGIDRYAAVRN